MSIEITGITEIKFEKPDQTDTVWMTLVTYKGTVSCTIWIPPQQFVEQMRKVIAYMALHVRKEDKFDSGWIKEQKDATGSEAKTTRV